MGDVGGLYDSVSGRFFPVVGSGTYTKGPDVVAAQVLTIYSDTAPIFSISTAYPLTAGAEVSGSINGSDRFGYLDSNLYSVYDADNNYVGEFIDPEVDMDTMQLRWFDGANSSVYPGYTKIENA